MPQANFKVQLPDTYCAYRGPSVAGQHPRQHRRGLGYRLGLQDIFPWRFVSSEGHAGVSLSPKGPFVATKAGGAAKRGMPRLVDIACSAAGVIGHSAALPYLDDAACTEGQDACTLSGCHGASLDFM